MNTNSTTAVGGYNQALSTMGSGSAMDKNVFLRLLVTQLRTQDPLNPMEDKEFITQLAQFTTLEQMQSMNIGVQDLNAGIITMLQSQSAFSALTLIGKEVEAINPDPNADQSELIKGKVEGIEFIEGSPILKVDGHDIPLSHVKKVS